MTWLYLLALYFLIGLLIDLGIDRSVTLARQFDLEQPLFGEDPRVLRILAIFAWPLTALWAAYLVIRRFMEPGPDA